jgi:branched-chain amino acid transport system permease protein
MDLSIATILLQDGVSTGAIYALLALAMVLVFSVTRVMLVSQGDFVAYGALSMAAMQAGSIPPTVWLLCGLGAACVLVETIDEARARLAGTASPAPWRRLGGAALRYLGYPLALALVMRGLPMASVPILGQVLLTLLLVVPIGPMLYRLAFRPLAESSTLVLLFVAVAVHFVMVGLGLVMFGAEGSRTRLFTDASFQLGSVLVTGQSAAIVGVSLALIGALYFFFERTLSGKALRATASNRTGARLMGIGTTHAGYLAFAVAATIGALSGILIAPITTMYYDSGFLIGMKGFVAAIIGGLASYPLAAGGAVLVGLLESFSAFWASAYREVIVFTLILPVLLWRSLAAPPTEESED